MTGGVDGGEESTMAEGVVKRKMDGTGSRGCRVPEAEAGDLEISARGPGEVAETAGWDFRFFFNY